MKADVELGLGMVGEMGEMGEIGAVDEDVEGWCA